MKKFLFSILTLFLSIHLLAYTVSGTAVDSETAIGLPGIELDLFLENGEVRFLSTGDDGSFEFNNIPDGGGYELIFHYYEPVIINGDYYLYTPYPDSIYVDGTDVNGIVFNIPPHHPVYHVSGTLYDATTNLPLSEQNMSLRIDFLSHSGFFFAWANDDGTYSFEDSIPDWTYDFHVFDNNYYYGDEVQLIIDTSGPQEITMDFYLQPKDGATVSGTLYDIETGEAIPIANRTIRLSAIYPEYAQTDADGNFTFVNVPPGYYTNMTVRTEDTAYINCEESTIYDFDVPEEGVSHVQIYQQKFEPVHVVNVDDHYYESGITKTLRFSLVYDNPVYGPIWGVELDFPPELTAVSRTPFYDYWTDNISFYEDESTCNDSSRLVWEGYHYVFGGSNVGNLFILNDSVYADVTLHFGDNMGDNTQIFFKVFYGGGGCYILQPFSYGYINLINGNVVLGDAEVNQIQNQIDVYPNPARNRVTFRSSFDSDVSGKIQLFNSLGQLIPVSEEKSFLQGNSSFELNTASLKNGLYFYTFTFSGRTVSGKLIISH